MVAIAMTGWGTGEPACWPNLQAHTDTTGRHEGGIRPLRGRVTAGRERPGLWARWRQLGDEVDSYPALRSGETAVVVLEPREAHKVASG